MTDRLDSSNLHMAKFASPSSGPNRRLVRKASLFLGNFDISCITMEPFRCVEIQKIRRRKKKKKSIYRLPVGSLQCGTQRFHGDGMTSSLYARPHPKYCSTSPCRQNPSAQSSPMQLVIPGIKKCLIIRQAEPTHQKLSGGKISARQNLTMYPKYSPQDHHQ